MGSLLDSFLSCKAMLSRVVGRMVRPDEIEDIVQETFVLSYAACRTQHIDNPKAFMLRVARNIALDQLKKADRRLNCSLEDLDEDELLSQLEFTELRYQSEERFLAFCRAVATLPVNCRRSFILKKVYGLSLSEISEHLDISKSTVEKQIAKGMLMVVKYMKKHGMAEPLTGNEQALSIAEVSNLE